MKPGDFVKYKQGTTTSWATIKATLRGRALIKMWFNNKKVLTNLDNLTPVAIFFR